jgi:hypothetical protein
MTPDPLAVSVETFVAVAPMLGYPLEERCRIREAQDPELVRRFQETSTRPLADPAHRALFLVAPLDVLVINGSRGKQFHIIETNGTGIGGLTNMPEGVVTAVLAGLTEAAENLVEPNPLVLVASSGIESHKNPRRNHLLHEKVLYADALRQGLKARHGAARVHCMARLSDDPAPVRDEGPAVVLGYIKEFLNALIVETDGRLTLFGRPVTLAVNDRFCLNVVSRFGGQVDLGRVATLNRSFAAGADKGVAYGLLNEFAPTARSPHCPDHIAFDRASCRAELIAGVTDWLRQGRPVVIKPQGTGLGHGLEFFLDPAEPLDAVVGKIDHSIRVTEHYYGLVGGAFPYTLCEFADTCTVARPGHPLHGHKYEARIVVYRDGGRLRAFPSIAKVSSQGYDADRPAKLSLINNITMSAEAKQREGTDFMLPLCNRETLDLLELDADALADLCGFCTGFVGHILDRVRTEPGRFGLPAHESGAERGVVNGQLARRGTDAARR